MDYAETYDGYAAQGILQIDAEIVKKSHFWMETNVDEASRPRLELHRKTTTQHIAIISSFC